MRLSLHRGPFCPENISDPQYPTLISVCRTTAAGKLVLEVCPNEYGLNASKYSVEVPSGPSGQAALTKKKAAEMERKKAQFLEDLGKKLQT